MAAMTVGALTNLRWGAPARAVFPEMDQLGNEPAVWLSEFTIEEGQDPIYLAVHANRGTALRFRGAVDRLSHVVVFTALDDRLRGKQEAAVIGLPRDKIHFVTQPRTTEHRFDCLDGNMLRPTPHLFAQTVRYMFGRDADRTIQSDSSAHVMLPSGKDGPALGYAAYEPRTPAARAVLRAFAAEQRHGAVRLSVNDIVSPAQYEEHERAPWVLGLLPLIDSGAITPLRPRVQRGLSVEGGQFLEVIGNPHRITLGAGVVATERHSYHRFRINAPVILPRMLGGPNLSEQIAFFLVPGVPRPEGFIPGKCLFDYGTGRPLLDAGVTLKDCE